MRGWEKGVAGDTAHPSRGERRNSQRRMPGTNGEEEADVATGLFSIPPFSQQIRHLRAHTETPSPPGGLRGWSSVHIALSSSPAFPYSPDLNHSLDRAYGAPCSSGLRIDSNEAGPWQGMAPEDDSIRNGMD